MILYLTGFKERGATCTIMLLKINIALFALNRLLFIRNLRPKLLRSESLSLFQKFFLNIQDIKIGLISFKWKIVLSVIAEPSKSKTRKPFFLLRRRSNFLHARTRLQPIRTTVDNEVESRYRIITQIFKQSHSANRWWILAIDWLLDRNFVFGGLCSIEAPDARKKRKTRYLTHQ